jgi:hypothetical protein
MRPRLSGIEYASRTGMTVDATQTKNLRNLMVPEVSGGWQMRDSNPRRRCQLIYSQPPLAARVICRTSQEVTLGCSLQNVRFRAVPLPVTAGKTTLQNLCRRIESGLFAFEKPQKSPGFGETNAGVRPRQGSGRPAGPRTSQPAPP